jgi:hypothetical protein
MDESNDPNDKGFATGEDNFSGGFAIVGEPGPEAFTFPPGSTIYPRCWASSSDITRILGNYKQAVSFPHEGMRFIPPNPAFGYLEIVRAVAEIDSTYPTRVDFDDVPFEWACPYCDGEKPYRVDDEPFPHDQDCIVLKARAMLVTMPHEVKE